MDISIALDDNARDVLTTIVQVGGGLLGGLVLALLGFRHARSLERERWVRAELRELYGRFASVLTRIRDTMDDPETAVEILGLLKEGRILNNEIGLLAPAKVADAALVAWNATADEAHNAGLVRRGLEPEPIDADWNTGVASFLVEARRDLLTYRSDK